jgi:diacylglycerol O-acyltransferase / trehalose O-mycolyltransferase
MGARDAGRRVLVGIAVVGLLGGCASSATLFPPPETPAVTAVPSVTIAAPSSAPAAGSARPTFGQPADDGASIVAVDMIDARTRDLTINSPTVGDPLYGGTVKVRLLLPGLFDAQPATRWPVLYLLAGSDSAYTGWTQNTDVEKLTVPTDLLVVMPDAGYGGGGWYSDWWNGGKGGPPKWETFHLVELRQLLERNWHAGDQRVIAGLSMGGYGAMEYAARQPGMFLAAASFSGPLNPLGGSAFLQQEAVPSDVWGDVSAQADVWKAHDPTNNASALKGTALYVAYGNGKIGPLDNGASSPWDPDGSVERDVATQSAAFVRQLASLKIPVTVDAYGNGTHWWPYFERDLHRSLPLMLKALGE